MIISPPEVTDWQPRWLPPYVANGVVGMRLDRAPFGGGTTIVNGFAGADPTDGVEGFAPAPFALGFDLEVAGVRVSTAMERLRLIGQNYDFACGELTTRWTFEVEGTTAEIESLAFASHDLPSVVVQETTVRTSTPTDMAIVGGVGLGGAPGRLESAELPPSGGPIEGVDGRLTWRSHGGLSRLGIAYATAFEGADEAERTTSPRDQRGICGTTYRWRSKSRRPYRLRQLTALVPEPSHHEPAQQAGRLAALGVQRGWGDLRRANRDAWKDLWRGRIELDTDDDRWQTICDATLFYLFTSVHPSSLASTSLFGLAYWPDYHYYHGHVMWDIETFVVPPLTLLVPDAARAILDYRIRHLEGAKLNARLTGRSGALYPWESCPLHGEEVTPGARPPMQEHGSMDVALAMAGYLQATGDRFEARRAWPVLRAVAEFVESRVERGRSGFHWRATVGPREDYEPVDDNAFVNMAASRALDEATSCADLVGEVAPEVWADIARRLVVPTGSRGMILNHAGATLREPQGGTPEGAAGLFPVGYRPDPAVEEATYRYAVEAQAPRYVGAPMFSALLPVFAARSGDRRAARRLLDEGYGVFLQPPFHEIDEFPAQKDRPRASPMFANMGGFLLALLYGFPGLRLGYGPVDAWAERDATLPAGWNGIHVERIHARRCGWCLDVRHGHRASMILA